jgi:hypothetical protein
MTPPQLERICFRVGIFYSNNLIEMEEKIKKWLNQGGLPLEMKFAHNLQQEGFDVAQSVYYRDNETNKFRETDIIASNYRKINEVWTHLTFVIECKKTVDKPWLVLKNDNLLNHLNDELPIFGSKQTESFLEELYTSPNYKSDLIFKNRRSIGYSLQTALLGNGKDRAYEAVSSVTKACEYLSQNLSVRENTGSIYMPVILIEGSLFEAKILNNDINVKQSKSSEVLIARSFHEYGNSHILIFDNSNLQEVSKHLFKLTEEFFEQYESLLKKCIKPHSNVNFL